MLMTITTIPQWMFDGSNESDSNTFPMPIDTEILHHSMQGFEDLRQHSWVPNDVKEWTANVERARGYYLRAPLANYLGAYLIRDSQPQLDGNGRRPQLHEVWNHYLWILSTRQACTTASTTAVQWGVGLLSTDPITPRDDRTKYTTSNLRRQLCILGDSARICWPSLAAGWRESLYSAAHLSMGRSIAG